MATFLKILGRLIAAVVALVVLVLIGARFADGPLEIIAGGPFRTGEIVSTEPDWSFIQARREVQFQLLDPARSRTTWIVEHEGRIYIPSGYMKSLVGKLWKHWPHEAMEDGRVLLRIDDDIYERQLVRVMDGPALPHLLDKLSAKYMGGGDAPTEMVTAEDLWIFEVVPRI
jgi:hypothetical protein